MDGTKASDLLPVIRTKLHPATRVMTDEAGHYRHTGLHFAEHGFTHHTAGEYVRPEAHTNTVESFYSVVKRGLEACISIAPRSPFTSILPSSISATTIARGLALKTRHGQGERLWASSGKG